MFCKRVIVAAVICIQLSSSLYGMHQHNDHHDIELGYGSPNNQPLSINLSSTPPLSQKFSVLKEEIEGFRTSVALKNTINIGIIGVSYICTGCAVLYKNTPLWWTGYGLFMTSLVLSNVQNFSSLRQKNELLDLVNDVERS